MALIYYKLDNTNHYPGDITKNCGLSGGEIDNNFNFLRGYDIKSFEVSDDKTQLSIIRLNGEKLTVNYEPNKYGFEYDKSKGILTVEYPDGETFEIEGFLTERFFRVYGDATIDGDGTRYNPVSVSSIARTGTYSPVNGIIDVIAGEKLPSSAVAKGDRYVTKEKISKLGLLYPLQGVMALQKRLEEIGSEWRVPTKEDWDQLLNIVEDCPDDKTHADPTTPTNIFLGVNAGAKLKSTALWEPIYRKLVNGEVVIDSERYTKDGEGNYIADVNGEYVKELYSEDQYKFTVYPTGFGERRGISTIGGFGKWAAYWTATEEDRYKDMFVKVFSNTEKGVEQNTWGKDCYLSLRLVKDYNGNNLFDVENIDGNTVSTIYIDTEEDDRMKYETSLVWTNENISFSNSEYGGVVSPEWADYAEEFSKIRYYINDWDGHKWVKHEMKQGESVVVLTEMHEWRLVGEEFVDTTAIIRSDFEEELNAIYSDIDNIKERTTVLESGLTTEIEERKVIDAEHKELIEKLENRANTLESDLATEIEERRVIDAEHKELIDGLGERTTVLEGRTSALETRTTVLENSLASEIEERKTVDAEHRQMIEENKVSAEDNSLIIIPGSTDLGGNITGTTAKVNLPENSMIKVDENGLYFDGDYSFGGNTINNI